MRSFLEEFANRRGEVRRYLAIIEVAESRMSNLERRRFERELKIFRAGALLVLYNAIEASARQGILAIYEEIGSTSTPFDELTDKLKLRILGDFRQHAGEKSYPRIRRLAIDLVKQSFSPDKLFAGNVDARKIRDMAQHFGFDTDTRFELTQHGQDLRTVKEQRQNLAHGTHSFSDVGKEYTTDDVRRIARFSLAYMSAILRHIDRYLDAEGYRIPRPSPPDPSHTPARRGGRSLRQRLGRAWAELRSR